MSQFQVQGQLPARSERKPSGLLSADTMGTINIGCALSAIRLNGRIRAAPETISLLYPEHLSKRADNQVQAMPAETRGRGICGSTFNRVQVPGSSLPGLRPVFFEGLEKICNLYVTETLQRVNSVKVTR